MPVNVSRLPADQRYHIARFLLSLGKATLARDATNQLADENPEWRWPRIKREHVYPSLHEEHGGGRVVLLPPLHDRLADEIARAYQLEREGLRVVDVRGGEARQAIADTAADTVLQLIREVARAKPGRGVHLGFAGGDLVSMAACSLGLRLAHEPGLPTLALHSVTAGFDSERPRTDPNTFSTYFDKVPGEKSHFCIYSSPFVSVNGYRKALNSEGVRASYQARTEIDIVITGMGSAEDPHSQLRRFHASASRLPDPSWVGEVGWLPYDAYGPAKRSAGIRGVALFELHELVDLARTRGKHVVVVAGTCRECGRPKGAALRPLVAAPALRCWTQMVLGLDSAQDLAALPAHEPMPAARRVRKAALRKDAVARGA